MKPRSTIPTGQELEIMKIVWERESATVRDVYEALRRKRKVAYTTVMTMMKILEEKKYLKRTQAERAYLYRPAQPKRQVIRAMVREFVNRVFNGSAEPLLVHLVEEHNLSSKDLEEIAQLREEAMTVPLLLSNVAAYSLQIGVIAVLAAIGPAVLRMKAPGVRLIFRQTAFACCLLLPLVRPWKQEIASGIVQVFTVVTTVGPKPHAARPDFSWPGFAAVVLAAEMLFRLGLIGIGFRRLHRYRRYSRVLEGPSTATGGATLRLSDEIPTPVNFGFLKPVILLPARFPDFDKPIREAILCHEVLHVRRHDWLFTVAEELVRAILWFHPAIWWMLGEIQLAREQAVDQAVIETTKTRDRYVDALLAMAGTQPRDPALSPPFLRRGHLKQRLVSIFSEVQMSRKKSISTLAAGIGLLAISSWLVTGAFPLAAAPQGAMDAEGIAVELNGSQAIHRTAVIYPEAAIAAGVQGTVVAQLKIDAKGNVSDATVISGPDELRKAVLQSVLNWHFTKHAASSTRQIAISFALPKNAQPAATGVAGSVPGAIPSSVVPVKAAPQSGRTITSISIAGISDEARTELLSRLPVHEGDTIDRENMPALIGAVHDFDEHLNVLVALVSQSEAKIVISPSIAPRPPPAPALAVSTSTGPRIRVGANVQAANVMLKINPVYPPEAKHQGIQGAVKLNVDIAPDGHVQNVEPVSGPPALVQAAVDAVKQWVYRPTLLDGNPVDVITTVDVIFTLTQ